MADKFYINILSLDRSRSTITNDYLAQVTASVSAGEVARVISPKGGEARFFDRDISCSCGQSVDACGFWSPIIGSDDRVKQYLKTFRDRNVSIIESSKTIRHSRMLRAELPPSELVALVILRDFKGWSTSVKAARQRSGEGSWASAFKDPVFFKSQVRLMMRGLGLSRWVEYTLTNIRLMREAAAYETAYLITSSNQLDAITLRGEGYEKHILRGNRVSRAGSVYLAWSARQSFTVRLLERLWGWMH